jgi:endonuclease YncB( thermonuclease family)
MKARSVVFALALCFIGAALSFAENPNMGTWKLDEAKSHIPAGFMKNSTVVYAADGDNVKVTTDGTDRDGKPMHTEWTGKFDGKDYPLSGDPTADSRSYRKLNERVLLLANKKDGKAVTSGRIIVSADGKTRTLKVSGTDSSGKKVSSEAVYEKQ